MRVALHGDDDLDARASARDEGVRAAWLYYAEAMTQAQIARAMGIPRARVIALLAAARDSGLVRVRIEAKSRAQAEIEQALVDRFALEQAVVAPAPAADDDAAVVVGHAAGTWLGDQLRDGLAVAVGWGATLHMSLKAVGEVPLARTSVISLLGGITHSRTITPATVARRLADALHGECYQLTAPLVVDDAAIVRKLWDEPGLADLRRRARRADLALISVGDVSAEATLFREGLLPASAIASLRDAGAVGDVLCRFLDARGAPVNHEVNRRTIAVGLEDVAAVPRIVVASGGRRKAAALRAALRALEVAVLITDESAARELLAGAGSNEGAGRAP
jgi:DNA-binding transcriptional regulator LsrR (DeoR family)